MDGASYPPIASVVNEAPEREADRRGRREAELPGASLYAAAGGSGSPNPNLQGGSQSHFREPQSAQA